MSPLIRVLLAVPSFSTQIFLMLFEYLKVVSTNIKWVLDFLLYHPFYNVHDHSQYELPAVITEEEEEVQIWRPDVEEEEVDCAVCLCKIGEGEEIRVLRCEHVFHSDCLNKWIGFKNYSCPLCRDFVGSGVRAIISEVGEAQVLYFNFCFFDSSDEPGTWWLR